MRRIKVRKRNGKWEVNPNGVAGCEMALTHDTYEDVINDLNLICASYELRRSA